jgi:vancomycin resistance protein VanJ
MKNRCLSWLNVIAWVYLTIVSGWFMAYLAFGDRFGGLVLFNMLAVYLFSPLPFAIVGAFFVQRKSLWAGVAVMCLMFIWLWGGLFIPKQTSAHAHAENNGSLSVMTYNLLGWQTHSENQIEVIRQENADVVMLQELNQAMNKAIASELAAEYPYRILVPGNNVTGMGVLSKYPLYPSKLSLGGDDWVGIPQIMTLEWHHRQVTLVNIHMTPSNSVSPADMKDKCQRREAQAQAVVDFVQGKEAVIVAGDTNTTPLSDAYKIVTSVLTDSWMEAGFGFGHTFPGSHIPGSSRPVIFSIPSPQWMVRIDYIFHTNRWKAKSAQTALFDEVSDHRGVIAILNWVE